ncbi:MAG: DNA double-strand break repair nuclease NurA, partial [Anaerolineae bacterium]|nr:DNA double-strand break repair nuclease NurA [Anaerolineae bacterium]
GERFIRLLYLLSLENEAALRDSQHGSPAGDLEGLRDAQFFRLILEPGERSALMVQNSPRNLEFKERGENYEIAFFYLNVGSTFTPSIVRVDVPVWVARHKQAVDELHALLLAQCRVQGRNPYPYVLTRAHELAVVSKDDQRKLEEMIKTQLRLTTDIPVDSLYNSAKSRSKFLLKSDRRRFDTHSVNRS